MSFWEASGPEGTLFILFIGTTIAVIVLRRIQSIVVRIDVRIFPLIGFFGLLLLALILRRAGEAGAATIDLGSRVG